MKLKELVDGDGAGAAGAGVGVGAAIGGDEIKPNADVAAGAPVVFPKFVEVGAGAVVVVVVVAPNASKLAWNISVLAELVAC